MTKKLLIAPLFVFACLPPAPTVAQAPGNLGQPGGVAAYGDPRLGDAVNVMAFGADATGAADSSAAFAAAIATGKTVLAPTGLFHTRHMVALQPGQRMVCMGRTVSQITVGADFSPTDAAVIQLPSTESNGSEIENCGITFAQPPDQTVRANFKMLSQGCTTVSGGTGCKYPWAIAGASNRATLKNLRISGAWDGISLTAGGWWLDDLEIGALDVGLYAENGLDFCHAHGLHFWPFGVAGATVAQPGSVWPSVYADGLTYGAQLGRCDGMSITDLVTFQARIAVLPTNTGVSIANLHLDGDHANLEVGGGDVRLADAYSTKSSAVSDSAILVTAGSLEASNVHLIGANPSPMVWVTGGNVILTGGIMEQANAAGQAVAVTGGYTLIRDFLMTPHAVAYSLPYVGESGGFLDLQNNKWSLIQAGGSGIAVQVGVDTAQQIVANNDFGGWGYAPPPSGVLGQYGPNKTPAVAFTPSLAFISSPGNFNPTYSVRSGHYWFTAAGIEFIATMSFNANTYTGASGQVAVTGLPFNVATPSSVENLTVSVNGGGITYDSGYTSLFGVILNPPNAIVLVEAGPGVGNQTAGTSIIHPGAGNITVTVRGLIPTS